MLVRNAFPDDFLEIANKSKEWADLVIERESIYHILTEHFRGTCFIAEDRGEMIGYLLGLRSQARPEEALVHLVQVAPSLRGNGVGRRMFNQFQAAVKGMGCTRIVTHSRPENNDCNRFYRAMGLDVMDSKDAIEVNGLRAIKDYNGPGKHRVRWHKDI
jgi:GNAT superfamily N-acetyltransferase